MGYNRFSNIYRTSSGIQRLVELNAVHATIRQRTDERVEDFYEFASTDVFIVNDDDDDQEEKNINVGSV